MLSCEIARCVSVCCNFAISNKTTAGKAFCCFSAGSFALKARHNLDKSLPSSPSSSRVGLGRLLSLKVDATYETAPRIVDSAKVS